MPRKKNTVMGFSAERLNDLIKKDNLSNKQICDNLGIERIATVSEWRNGKKEPSSKHLEALCRLFKVERAYFYPGTPDNEADAILKGREFAADLHYDDVIRNADINTQIEQDLLMIDRPQIVYLANFMRSYGYEISYLIKKKGKVSSSASVVEAKHKAATIIKSVNKAKIEERKDRLKHKEYEKIQLDILGFMEENPGSISLKKENLKMYRLQKLYKSLIDQLDRRLNEEPNDLLQYVYDGLAKSKNIPMQWQFEIEKALKELKNDAEKWSSERKQFKRLSDEDPYREIKKHVVWKECIKHIRQEYDKIAEHWNAHPFDWKRYEDEYTDDESRKIYEELDQLFADLKANEQIIDSLAGKLRTEAALSYNEISDFREALDELRSGVRYDDEIYQQYDILVKIAKNDAVVSKMPLVSFEVYSNTLVNRLERDMRDISTELIEKTTI